MRWPCRRRAVNMRHGAHEQENVAPQSGVFFWERKVCIDRSGAEYVLNKLCKIV